MGGHEGQAQSNGFLPNGLLPSEAAYVTRVLDPERWSSAEERIVELISCIQPNQPSEERRNSVACYVQQLIMKCFSCQVFAFGSVPLKTYLPDGDIDLTAFTSNQNLKDTWASKVRDMLESEKKSDEAEFHVNEVQYIQSEVKIVKCLVENIVVDISFDQLGGLCTLCFLEKVDHLINQNHLFKRSIILIKAWCYYESRILGAHHGLISTYTLETLVMYIFHVFNNSFAGPLEVLYRFLEFFSRFDWDNFCISLWGPVPICSLPGMTADPPRKDGRELLSSKIFIDACCSVYADFSGGQKNQEQPFISKYLNVIDPLRTSNNLGRSVSKGNFFRIRSAFGFGAQRLARLLDCPKGNLIAEVDQFFMNTWRRHGKSHRTDVPDPLYGFRPLDLNNLDDSDSLSNYSSDNKAKENGSSHASKVEATRASCAPNTASFQHGNHSLRQSFRTSNLSSSSHPQNQKTYAHLANSMASVQNNHSAQNCRPNYLGNEVHATYPSVGRHNRVSASMIPANVPMINSPRSSSMHYSQGLVSFPVPQYPHNVGMACHREEVVVLVDDDFASRGMLEGDSGYGLSLKGETNSRRVFDSNNGAIIKENRELIPETHDDNFQYHSIGGTDVSSQSTSSKSKLSSEGSQNQSPTKVLKSKMERRGRKTVPSTEPSSVYGLHKHGQIFEGASVDHHYFQGTDGVWIALPTVGTKATDITIPLSAPAFVQTHQIPNYERTEMNGSNPELPIAPLIVGSGSRKSGINDHGVLPFAFYPSGPPLPFVTMLPLYKFPNEGGISGASTIYSDREEEHNNWHVGQFDQNFHSAENVD